MDHGWVIYPMARGMMRRESIGGARNRGQKKARAWRASVAHGDQSIMIRANIQMSAFIPTAPHIALHHGPSSSRSTICTGTPCGARMRIVTGSSFAAGRIVSGSLMISPLRYHLRAT